MNRDQTPLPEQGRQAIIEHNRLMKSQRQWAAENRARLDAEYAALKSPPRTIAAHLAEAKAEMGEARWAELQKEWEQ